MYQIFSGVQLHHSQAKNDILKTCSVSVITLMLMMMMTSAHFRELSGLYGADFETFLLMFF